MCRVIFCLFEYDKSGNHTPSIILYVVLTLFRGGRSAQRKSEYLINTNMNGKTKLKRRQFLHINLHRIARILFGVLGRQPRPSTPTDLTSTLAAFCRIPHKHCTCKGGSRTGRGWLSVAMCVLCKQWNSHLNTCILYFIFCSLHCWWILLNRNGSDTQKKVHIISYHMEYNVSHLPNLLTDVKSHERKKHSSFHSVYYDFAAKYKNQNAICRMTNNR